MSNFWSVKNCQYCQLKNIHNSCENKFAIILSAPLPDHIFATCLLEEKLKLLWNAASAKI